MHCNLSDDKMHATYIRPCINKKKKKKKKTCWSRKVMHCNLSLFFYITV